MVQALWKGVMSFSLVTIPVALYPAKSSRSSVTFHMLHKQDLARVHNKLVDEEGHEVPYDEVVKGYEYEKGRYVVVTGEDLERANVEATQSVDIMHFVPLSDIDVAYYDTPYYTEPAKAGRKAYALLRETLRRTSKAGVAKLVIRERQHLCAVVADGPALLAYTLRWPYQLRDSSLFDLPGEDLSGVNVSDQELRMAQQLVEAMTTVWTPEQYRDTYRDDLLHLIEEKARDGEVTEAAAPRQEPAQGKVVDLMALLQRSMEKQKVANRRTSGSSGVTTSASKKAPSARAREKS